MLNTESNTPSQKTQVSKTPLFKGNLPLAVGAAILVAGSGLIGYSIGHRQGLTTVGFEADAEQLVEVVQQQKTRLDALNKTLNLAVQERDVSMGNANDVLTALNQARADKVQSEGLGAIYREVLRQRGGLSLTIQNIGIKPLPDNAYEYELDLVQVSPNKRNTSGSIELRLIQGTEVLIVPMEDKNFNFQEYERLTGRWTMPKGFTPQFIEVRLTGTTPVIKRFSWGRGKPIESQSSLISEIPQAEANVQ